MTGGTLLVTREAKMHPYYKSECAGYGFENITMTDADNDGLNSLIYEMKPKIVLMGSMFYKCCTPYRVGQLHKQFPKQNIAVISLSIYPNDLAMYFIINGAKSYINFYDGFEQFKTGITDVRRGNEFVSEGVVQRIDLRKDCDIPRTGHLTQMQIEIIRCVANGFSNEEIATTLAISERSVDTRKSEIYKAMNVRNGVELTKAAEELKIISPNERIFFGDNFVLRPKPDKKTRSKK